MIEPKHCNLVAMSVMVMLFVGVIGCDGNGGSSHDDAGQDGMFDADADPDSDAGSDSCCDAGDGDASDGASGDDGDLGDDFAVVIPANTQACTQNFGNVFHALETKGRVTFRQASVRLPRGAETIEVDIIESVDLGPTRPAVNPRGPGEFQRTVLQEQGTEIYRYEYTQEFDVDGEVFGLVFRANFQVQDGVALSPVLTIDEDTLTHRLYMQGQEANRFYSFNTCRYSFYGSVVNEYAIDGGHTLTVEQHTYCPVSDVGCKSSLSALTRAEFDDGTQGRFMDDFFRLVCVMGQHDWWVDYLVVLDLPVGSVHAMHLYWSNVDSNHQAEYLDADLNVLDTRTVLSRTQRAVW